MADREWSVKRDDLNIIVLAVISGLDSEIGIIRDTLGRHRPDAIGLSVTEAQLDYLRKLNASGEQPEPEYSDFDLFYIREMSRFGRVIMPSPSHIYAVGVADETETRIIGLDMDEESYANRYMQLVGPASLFLDSILRKRRMKRHLEGSAEEVSLKLDMVGRHPKGVDVLDRERERHMAKQILKGAAGCGVFLAIIDYDRAAGVRSNLESGT